MAGGVALGAAVFQPAIGNMAKSNSYEAPTGLRNDQPAESQAAAKPEPRRENVAQVADALQQAAAAMDRKLEFNVDDQTGKLSIKVLDGNTGEVIREVPPEDYSNYSPEAIASLSGLLFNEAS